VFCRISLSNYARSPIPVICLLHGKHANSGPRIRDGLHDSRRAFLYDSILFFKAVDKRFTMERGLWTCGAAHLADTDNVKGGHGMGEGQELSS
jgi:hypothetical protein